MPMIALNGAMHGRLSQRRWPARATAISPGLKCGLCWALAPGSVTLPTDKFVEPTDAEFYWQGKIEGSPPAGGHQVK